MLAVAFLERRVSDGGVECPVSPQAEVGLKLAFADPATDAVRLSGSELRSCESRLELPSSTRKPVPALLESI
jgi:hypothetical protein